MSVIDFFVPGEPFPQPRARASVLWMRGRPQARIYTPSDANEWKEQVGGYATQATPVDRACVGPLRLCTRFLMPRPESHFLSRGVRPDAPVFHTNERADVDNLVKAVMDALTDCRLWLRDGLVCQLYAEKRYAQPGQQTGARVQVSRCIEDHMLFQEIA